MGVIRFFLFYLRHYVHRVDYIIWWLDGEGMYFFKFCIKWFLKTWINCHFFVFVFDKFFFCSPWQNESLLSCALFLIRMKKCSYLFYFRFRICTFKYSKQLLWHILIDFIRSEYSDCIFCNRIMIKYHSNFIFEFVWKKLFKKRVELGREAGTRCAYSDWMSYPDLPCPRGWRPRGADWMYWSTRKIGSTITQPFAGSQCRVC